MDSDEKYCSRTILNNKINTTLRHLNGTETSMIAGLNDMKNTSTIATYCMNENISDIIYTLTEIGWRCPEILNDKPSNETSPSLSWNTDEAKVFLTIIFVFVGIVGFLGNLMTVVVIYRTLHSRTNYFLASLAVSDLLLIAVGVPFDLVSLWRGSLAPAIIGYCEVTSTTISWFTFVSILIIVALTAERLVAICYPFYLESWFTSRRVVRLIIAIWGFAFFPSLYIGLQFKQVISDACGTVHLVDIGHGYCDFVGWVDFSYTFEIMMFITFVLPILFIIYAYFRILGSLNEMQHNHTDHLELENLNSDSSTQIRLRLSGRPTSQNAQRVVTKMLITVSVIFFICYLPYHVERLIVWYSGQLCQKSTICLLLYPITGLLQYVSATLNPIIYNLMSLRFRRAFSTLIQEVLFRRHPTRFHISRNVIRHSNLTTNHS